MMKVGIIPNLSKKDATFHTAHIIKVLNDLGSEVLIDDQYLSVFPDSDLKGFSDLSNLIRSADVLIAIGGDGTIIHAAKNGAIEEKPILGVNLGRMGFVAELERNELNLLGQLVQGNYKIDKRMMLSVTYPFEGRQVTQHVFNEAVLSRGALSKIIDIKVSSSGNLFGSYRADGIIVATPTGSTAYSLSAGGPIIDPTMECVLLTPVCPVGLLSRTVVFDSSIRLTLESYSQYNSDVYLTLDGEYSVQINPGDQITIEKSCLQVNMIKLKQNSFLETVKTKIGN